MKFPMNADSGKRVRNDWSFLSVVLCAICMTATFAFALPQAQDSGPPVARVPRPRVVMPDPDHPILKIGAPAPDFSLPGVDGKLHSLKDYASAKILAVVFESNHCPVSIVYEDRMRKIYEDYRNMGLAFIAINPNNPGAVRLDELAWTDASTQAPMPRVSRSRSSTRSMRWMVQRRGRSPRAMSVVAPA